MLASAPFHKEAICMTIIVNDRLNSNVDELDLGNRSAEPHHHGNYLVGGGNVFLEVELCAVWTEAEEMVSAATFEVGNSQDMAHVAACVAKYIAGGDFSKDS